MNKGEPMDFNILSRVAPILNVIKELTEDELAFLKKYIESTLADDFKDMFHHFIDAQVKFIEQEISEKII